MRDVKLGDVFKHWDGYKTEVDAHNSKVLDSNKKLMKKLEEEVDFVNRQHKTYMERYVKWSKRPFWRIHEEPPIEPTDLITQLNQMRDKADDEMLHARATDFAGFMDYLKDNMEIADVK